MEIQKGAKHPSQVNHMNKQEAYTLVAVVLSTIALIVSVHLILDSINLLRTSNAMLLGIGESIKGFNEFKILAGIFLSGLVLAIPISCTVWIFLIRKKGSSQ